MKELYAYGIIHIASANFGCFAATGALARSSLNEASGAKSQVRLIIVCCVDCIMIDVLIYANWDKRRSRGLRRA